MKFIDAGQCVRNAQSYKNISSSELARIAKTSKPQVIRWRSNKNMKLHTAQLIAMCLDITLDEFLAFGN